MAADPALKTIHFVSLGCPKNRVDSEVMLGVALDRGYAHVDDAEEAEVIVVNTCGFIDPAKKESIETILAMADLKEEGRCEQLVVAGCLSQRHPDEMAAELPEVDHFLGSSDMLRIGDVLDGGANRVLVGTPADWLIRAESPRQISSRGGSAYLKIAEGCNRKCSFCVIPQLRGKQRSRSIDDVVREAEALVAQGVVELNLISQDTVSFGRDQKGGAGLAALVERVADVAGLRWLRLFYLYPEKLDERLIELMAEHPTVVPYVDMPLQHAADGMLARMRRGHGGDRMRRLVERLRREIDDLTFRTAFIVGHPGETDAEFEELCEFVAWAEFERVGVFRYSDEETSHSFSLDLKAPEDVADERYHKLMTMARRISRDKNENLIGRSVDVLVEGVSDEHDQVLVGRHRGQAPDIDGQVFLSGLESLDHLPQPGTIIPLRVTQATDYDLAGEVLEGPVSQAQPRRLAVIF
ncbi:MAG: 30S ribosomal protein S12 methylthiotransferase RimO, partial [Myxococcota bacterium]